MIATIAEKKTQILAKVQVSFTKHKIRDKFSPKMLPNYKSRFIYIFPLYTTVYNFFLYLI